MQEELARVDLVGAVESAIEKIGPPRLADVLRMRIGIDGEPPMTLAEIGQRIDLSRERVRQLEDKGLSRLTRQVKTSPGGDELVARLKEAIRPRQPGWQGRVAEAVAVLCPDWPTALCRKILTRMVGAKEGPMPREQPKAAPQTGNLYDAVATRFEGVRVTGRSKRFDEAGWFSVGETPVPCPACGLPLQGFRAPYETSGGIEYHRWGVVCVHCRLALTPADLAEDARQALYKASQHRPRPTGREIRSPPHPAPDSR